MENNQESVTHSESNSVQSESVKVETKHDPNEDFKRDMFKWKQRAKELEEQLREKDLAVKHQTGDVESVIQALKEDLKKEKSKNIELQKTFAEERLEDEIIKTAMSKGIKDNELLDVFRSLVKPEDKNMIGFDERFRPSQDDVSLLVDKHLQRYAKIFQRNVNVVDAPPSSKPHNKPDEKLDISKMSSQDLVQWALKNKEKFV